MLPVTNLLSIELAGDSAEFPLSELRTLPEVKSAAVESRTLSVGLHDLSAGAPKVLQWLADHGYPYTHVVTERPDLETVFLSLTGRSLRD